MLIIETIFLFVCFLLTVRFFLGRKILNENRWIWKWLILGLIFRLILVFVFYDKYPPHGFISVDAEGYYLYPEQLVGYKINKGYYYLNILFKSIFDTPNAIKIFNVFIASFLPIVFLKLSYLLNMKKIKKVIFIIIIISPMGIFYSVVIRKDILVVLLDALLIYYIIDYDLNNKNKLKIFMLSMLSASFRIYAPFLIIFSYLAYKFLITSFSKKVILFIFILLFMFISIYSAQIILPRGFSGLFENVIGNYKSSYSILSRYDSLSPMAVLVGFSVHIMMGNPMKLFIDNSIQGIFIHLSGFIWYFMFPFAIVGLLKKRVDYKIWFLILLFINASFYSILPRLNLVRHRLLLQYLIYFISFDNLVSILKNKRWDLVVVCLIISICLFLVSAITTV